MPRTSIVCCSTQGDDWRWVEPRLSDVAEFHFAKCPESLKFRIFNLSRFIGSVRAILLARKTKASILVTHEPTIAFWCATLLSILRMKVTIFAHSFNFSNLPGPFKRRLFSLAYRRVERFAVFSEMERGLYANAFRLNRSKLDFIRWGVNCPTLTDPGTPMISGDYISAVGGNSRDYRTLVDAARSLPQSNFVLVARPENLLNIELPKNVKVYKNIPFGNAMNLLAFSKATVLPLDRTDAPCGHVTIVAAMYLGVPVIATNSAGIDDYISNGKTGILVERRSPSSIVDAILQLEKNKELRDSIIKECRIFVNQNCSEKNIADHFRGWLATQSSVSEFATHADEPTNKSTEREEQRLASHAAFPGANE